MRDIDAPLVQQVLDVPQQRLVVSNHHHSETEDLGLVLRLRKIRALLMPWTANAPAPAAASRSLSDSACQSPVT